MLSKDYKPNIGSLLLKYKETLDGYTEEAVEVSWISERVISVEGSEGTEVYDRTGVEVTNRRRKTPSELFIPDENYPKIIARRQVKAFCNSLRFDTLTDDQINRIAEILKEGRRSESTLILGL